MHNHFSPKFIYWFDCFFFADLCCLIDVQPQGSQRYGEVPFVPPNNCTLTEDVFWEVEIVYLIPKVSSLTKQRVKSGSTAKKTICIISISEKNGRQKIRESVKDEVIEVAREPGGK